MLLRDFIKALKFVVPAMGKKDYRSYLNGVHLAFAPAILTLTATDGYRLHTVEMCHDHGQSNGSYILDADTVKRWSASTLTMPLDLTVALGVPILHGSVGTLIAGRYPDVSRVSAAGITRATEVIHFNSAYLSAAMGSVRHLGKKSMSDRAIW